MSHIKIVGPSTSAQRATSTTLDTWEVTPAVVRSWKLPSFQRPLHVNAKVMELAGQIALDGGVIPGVMCLGLLGNDRYLVDGQHRREAFLLSDCSSGYVDVRVVHFSSMAEMAEEFVNLNSRLVNMRADDIIRGLESSYPAVERLRRACPFIGYGQIRRGAESPVLSMSSALRCWTASSHEVPHSTGTPAAKLAVEFSDEDCRDASAFLGCAFEAWGRDESASRLWGGLNLTICGWLYRRTVLRAHSAKTQLLSRDQFTRCLMSIGADAAYSDWVVGRRLSARDLAPAYSKIKQLFSARLESDTGRKHLMPQPNWATSSAGRKK